MVTLAHDSGKPFKGPGVCWLFRFKHDSLLDKGFIDIELGSMALSAPRKTWRDIDRRVNKLGQDACRVHQWWSWQRHDMAYCGMFLTCVSAIVRKFKDRVCFWNQRLRRGIAFLLFESLLLLKIVVLCYFKIRGNLAAFSSCGCIVWLSFSCFLVVALHISESIWGLFKIWVMGFYTHKLYPYHMYYAHIYIITRILY